MDEAAHDEAERNRRILAMRDGGAAWSEVEAAFTLTRQQARYAYQKAKREARRRNRRIG
jgi:hypothetical protein